jgi:hypothetical protein
MARVRVIIERKSDADLVTFMDDLGTQNLGRKCRFTSDDQVFEMLRHAGASLELRNIVADGLRRERRCVVVLNLTEEQYAKLKHQMPCQ